MNNTKDKTLNRLLYFLICGIFVFGMLGVVSMIQKARRSEQETSTETIATAQNTVEETTMHIPDEYLAPEYTGELTLPELGRLVVRAPAPKIPGDMNVSYKINALLKEDSMPVTNRTVMYGDTVTFDFSATINGQDIPGYTDVTDYVLDVEKESWFFQDLVDSFVGHKAGDVYDKAVHCPSLYPENISDEAYAVFHVALKEVSRKANFDYDFIQRHTTTGAQTPDEFKEEIRSLIRANEEALTDDFALNEALQFIIDNTNYDISDSARSYFGKIYDEHFNSELQNSGISVEEYMKEYFMTSDDLKNMKEEAVYASAKEYAVYLAIAQKMNLPVNADSLTAYSKALNGTTMDSDALYETYGDSLFSDELEAAVKAWLAGNIEVIYETGREDFSVSWKK